MIDLTLIDEPLRSELASYDITIPHAQSVLSPTIESYHAQLYYKLCAMEAWTYTHTTRPNKLKSGVATGTATIAQYQPFWQQYNTTLLDYLTHAAIPKSRFKDLIQGLYCFMHVRTRGFGDPTILNRSDAKTIFTLDGAIERILGYALSYYDDFIPEDPSPLPPATTTPDNCPHLEDDGIAIATAWDEDAVKVDELIATYADAVSDCTTKALFSNEGATIPGPSPQAIWDKIFMDLHWQWYAEYFHSDVDIPPRPA